MSSGAFMLFQRFFPLGVEVLYALCLTLFLRPFIRPRWRAWVVLGVYPVVSLCCGWPDAPQGLFTLLMILLLTAAGNVLGIGQGQALFLTLLYWNARTCMGIVLESLYFMAEHLWTVPVSSPEAMFSRSTVLLAGLVLSHGVLTGAVLWGLQRQLRRRPLNLHPRELCCLSLVPVAGVLLGQVVSHLLVETQDGTLLELYQRHPAFLVMLPVIALLFCAGSWLTVRFQQDMEELRREQADSFVERRQAQAIRERLRETEKFYANMRQLRHDMRGHLTNIKGLARSGEYESLDRYIAQMDESIRDFELALPTGNPVTDVIVNDKRQQCLDQGIRFQADFHYPAGGFDPFDLGIILQNLLQNALEACQKTTGPERFITLNGKRRGRFFLIEVRNPFEGEVTFGPDGLPMTTKENGQLHGVGLGSVRRAAGKYMGEVELSAEGGIFEATVMLQNKD